MDRLANLMRIRVRDLGGEPAAPQHDRDAVLRPGSHGRFDPPDLEFVEGLREFLRPLPDPSRAAIREFHVLVDRGEVPAECDVSRLQLDADARGLKRTAARVDLPRIVSEEREVARVASRGDAGRDRIHESIHAVRREPIEIRLRGRLEGRLVPEFRERATAEAVENQEQDFPRIHFPSPKVRPLGMSWLDSTPMASYRYRLLR